MPDFSAKMYQIQFGWGSAPDPDVELTMLPDPLCDGGLAVSPKNPTPALGRSVLDSRPFRPIRASFLLVQF